jgi:RimJ/RimL family protein N-acetyltransferase
LALVQQRLQIDWATPVGELRAIEPALEDVRPHIPALAEAYNDLRNAALLGHTSMLTEADVLEHYESLLHAGRPFLLFRNGVLAGDADLRSITNLAGAGPLSGFSGEFAFLIADPDAQGRGLGTRFAVMVHAAAFGRLELARIYAAVVPQNVASRRVFEKLGYAVDDSEAARAYGDHGDVVLALDRAVFERLHAEAVAEIRIAVR